MRKIFPSSMYTCAIMFVCTFSCHLYAQYNPITITGFNHDVVAEGTGTNSLTTTTKEMDAITPSNFVMCTKQFATVNAFTPVNTYGLPDNGTIIAGTKTFQFAPFTANNASYLLTSETATLALATPARYTGISLLVLATEGNANVSVTFNFTDATNQIFNNQTVYDWFNAASPGVALSGFGRVKRKVGPYLAAADYEGVAANQPKIYSLEYMLPCSKTLASVTIKNNSGTAVTASNRAFVFAISGIAGAVPALPVVSPLALCSAGPATLSVVSPPAGTNYTWYAAATGGFASGTGANFTTPSLTVSTTYYVAATNALSGCVSDPRVPVTVTISSRPAAPMVNPVNVCPNSTATLVITAPVAGVSYNWYTAATGGTAVSINMATYVTPVITASTTYYVEAVSAGGCVSTTRTPVPVTFLPKLPTPVTQATTVGVNTVTFSWTAIAGATGYQVSVNNGAYQTPSSGATGLTHTASGLQPLSNISFKVIALGPQNCQNSDSATAAARTLTDEIYIPNSFTPNGDNRNDVFKAYGNVIAGINMVVFNQWGQKIFETTDINLGWNGTYKNKQQPVGLYVYVMNLRLLSGTSILKKGAINLIR